MAIPLVQAVFRTSDIGSATALTALGFDSLKLYATFDPGQRAALAAKRPIALASLTNGQRDLIARMVYNGPTPPMAADGMMAKALEGMNSSTKADGTTEDENADGMAGLGMAMAGPMMAAFGFGGEMTSLSERTNLMPEGIPVTGSIRLNLMKTQALMATDTMTGMATISAPEMLAMMSGSGGGDNFPMFQGMQRNYDQYKLAHQTVMLFTFDFAKRATFFTSLYDVSVENGKTYRKDELSKKMQERLKPLAFAKPVEATPPPVQ